jgi:serine protease AprX
MDGDVIVRLVPKTRAAVKRVDFSLDALSRNASDLRPDPKRGRSALGWLSGRVALAGKTDKERLEISLSRTDFAALFKTSLIPGRYSDSPSRRRTAREAFEAPDRALLIPTELQDAIDYAYVPRPIEFYAPGFRPPLENVEHLSLSDVCAALNAARAHRLGWTGAHVKVAMVDSGFHPHPHFAAHGYKLIPIGSPGAGDAQQDASGHGTGECANIFAIAPNCTVYGVKSGASAATSLEAALAQAPDILSNSWGFDVDNQTREDLAATDPNFFNEMLDIESIVADAVQNGVIVVFAAGNGHRAFPASMPQVIAAGGVTLLLDGTFEASSYASSFVSQLYPGRRVPDVCGLVGMSGPTPQQHHIMLPVPPGSDLDGENFPSGRKNSGWGIFSGTSAACPQLAGAVALLREVHKGARTDQVRTALSRTATDIVTGTTATGDRATVAPDPATGAGLVNIRAACEFLGSVT